MIKISSQIRAKRPEYQLTCDQLRFDLLFYKPKSHARVVGNEGPPHPPPQLPKVEFWAESPRRSAGFQPLE